ncbi:hypothetical protein [Siphonobacter sp. SORGH_AS_1065]|uniref:hypothetical protein n=1 Tax=Siphonobacter sp. SORGH_AS_1065 TaxID=3041795 RepID=UPI0027858B35|nr:hypothetical protein [Siphonobacter sp. SORGH_AS_1065]MDQ1086372.1 hypothetical protein [Siphonobacter sp. SORGH_AS_1065]
MEDVKNFETALLKRLSHAEFDKEFLRSASGSIVEMRKMGFDIHEAFPKGKIRFDRVFIKGQFPPDMIPKLGDAFKINGLNRFDVFPIGILSPDLYRFQLTLKM